MIAMIAQTLRTVFVWILLIAPVFLPKALSSTPTTPEPESFELCSNETVQQEGQLTSPNYPDNYDTYLDCLTTITAGPGQIVYLFFQELLLEDCYDYLYLYDGNSTDSPFMVALCEDVPLNIGAYRSTGRHLTLEFTSDSGITNKGFLANVAFILPESCDVIVDQEGQITSPNYPAIYENFMVCRTTITAGIGQVVRLIFQDFKLEYASTCNYDALSLYDGDNDDSSAFLGTFCDTTSPGEITSTGQRLLLVLRSDDYLTFRGFQADVQFIPVSVEHVTLEQHRGLPGVLIADLEFNIGMCEWSRIEVMFPRRLFRLEISKGNARLQNEEETTSGGKGYWNGRWMTAVTIVPKSSDRAQPGPDGKTYITMVGKIWRKLKRFKANIKADIHYYTC